MGRIFLKLLFWPWFGVLRWMNSNGTDSADRFGFWSSILPVAAIFLTMFFLFVLFRLKERSDPWPSFIKNGTWLSFFLFCLGCLGGISNLAFEVCNNYRGMGTFSGVISSGHFVIDEGTKLKLLGDRILIDHSKLLQFIFAGYESASPGDVIIAVSIIFSWWVALFIVGRTVVYILEAARKKLFGNSSS